MAETGEEDEEVTEKIENDKMLFSSERPLQYRWSGKFVGKDASWKHMERQLLDYELIVMEKGTLYIEDEWRKYEVSEGEWLIMEPTRLQRGYKASKCRFYWAHFLQSAEEVFGREEGRILLPRQGRLPNADRVFVLLRQLQDSDLRYMDPVYNGYLLTSVLCEMAAQQRSLPGKEEDFLQKVDDYLLRHVGDPISVGELAREFGYHEKYFSALFKEKTGQSVKRYVDGRKVERAKYLLLNTDAYVAEIAEHLGYGDVQNLYHLFKKYLDCTPTEFREQYCKKQEFNV